LPLIIGISCSLWGEALITITSGKEAEVFINNESQGTISPSGSLEITLKKPSKYVIEIRAKNSPLLYREEINVTKIADIKKELKAFYQETPPPVTNPSVSAGIEQKERVIEKRKESGSLTVYFESYYNTDSAHSNQYSHNNAAISRAVLVYETPDYIGNEGNVGEIMATTWWKHRKLIAASYENQEKWHTISADFQVMPWELLKRGNATLIYSSPKITLPEGNHNIFLLLVFDYLAIFGQRTEEHNKWLLFPEKGILINPNINTSISEKYSFESIQYGVSGAGFLFTDSSSIGGFFSPGDPENNCF